jgi:hypothetical protein
MAKRKSTKEQIMIYKIVHKTKDRVTGTPQNPGMLREALQFLLHM